MYKKDKKKKIRKDGGQIIILVALFTLFISTSIISIISSPVVSQLKTNRDLLQSKKSYFISEGGNEDIVYRIKNGESISGQKDLIFAEGLSATTVTDIGSGVKEVTTIANVNNKIRKIKSRIQVASGVSFNYGLFTGQGGLDIDNNSIINGSVYSGGNIIGASNTRIGGDVYVATRPATTTDVQWINYNEDFEFARYFGGQPRVDVTQSFQASSSPSYLSKMGLYIKKVGSPANLNVKIAVTKSGNPDKNNIIANGTVSSTLISENYSFIEVGFDANPELLSGTTYWLVVDMVRDDTNYYVWGIDNTDSYTNGTAKYSSDWTKSTFFDINGDLNFKLWVSDAENNGLLSGLIIADEFGGGDYLAHAHNIINTQVSGDAIANIFSGGTVGGDLTADSILNCTVNGNANYNTSSNCLVGGTEHSPTPVPSDPPYLVPPISEANITAWKDDAISFGIITTGNLIPYDGDSIGPGVVNGDLIIEDGTIVNLEGTLYVKGNIEIHGNAGLNLGISYGTDRSGAVISDGWVDLYNNVVLNSPRTGTGHLMILTTANCDKYYGYITCNSENAALSINNNVVADILITPYGSIRMNNNVDAVSLVADTLWMNNNIILNYEQGLTNMDFSSGPSATWSIQSWREIE